MLRVLRGRTALVAVQDVCLLIVDMMEHNGMNSAEKNPKKDSVQNFCQLCTPPVTLYSTSVSRHCSYPSMFDFSSHLKFVAR